MKGILYVVATPIGNLNDISLRAIQTLEEADLILAEDTRQTKKLLKSYEIDTELQSYREQNHERIIHEIVGELQSGKNLALVSDSGTPAISDPGFNLVRVVHDLDIKVITIPGPSAITAALSISGLPTDKFTFLGFLPKSSSQRKKTILRYGSEEATLIIYESPYRIEKLLWEINETLGDRMICIASELTKKFENVTRGHVQDILQNSKEIPHKGELTVLIAKEDFS